MKLLAIMALIAASFIPVLPAAASTCSDEIDNHSSLSSASEGGAACQTFS